MNRILIVFGFLLISLPTVAQEKSVRPGINKPFENPDVKGFLEKFEVESREIFAQRKAIVAACKIKPGTAVADIGAGTGLFTRLFAKEVGDKGKVYAVEISKGFLGHIDKTCMAQGIKNVAGVLCDQTSTNLPERSIDLAFVCDTYHHFEFPRKTLQSIHRALKPGGQLMVIDFKRVQGTSSEWVMNHVRAGQEVLSAEIRDAGFKQLDEIKMLKENYFLRFERLEPAAKEKK
ncbi:MAG: methyltransferase domain-containing protein [Planctomycetes bacterium]|nr:methyltransferase domain-containing protein [Planctomycetota bacterium]